jgi:hypothetical protein
MKKSKYQIFKDGDVLKYLSVLGSVLCMLQSFKILKGKL